MPAGRLLRLLTLLSLLVGLLLPAAGRAEPAAAGTEFTLSVIPVLPPAEMKRRWQPVLDEIARSSGLRLRFHFYPDMARFAAGLTADEVDFAVASPPLVWQLRQRYRPLVRGGLPLHTQVVVRTDSPLHGLADLEGRSLALQDGPVVAGTLQVLRTLRQQKIQVKVLPMNSAISALRSVTLGGSDAALVSNYILQLVPPELVRQVRAIHQAPDLPPPAILASLHCPPEVTRKFRDAVLALRQSHPELLAAIVMSAPVDADLQRDYGDVPRLLAPDPVGGAP